MTTHPPYAGIVSRFAAIGVDAVLLAVVVAAVTAGAPAVWNEVIGTPPTWLERGVNFVGLLLPLAYFTIAWAASGQTAGGLLMGIRVQRSDGKAIGFPLALLRAFFGLLLVPIWLVGMVLVLFSDRRQALHDKVFGTVVRFMPAHRSEATQP